MLRNYSAFKKAMVKIITEKGSFDIQNGSFSPDDLFQLDLYCTKIIQIIVHSGNEVTIIPNINKETTYHFNSDSKVDIKIHKCAKIICSPEEWDYIIVGLGAAGSILARKLSDDLKTKVLVLEAGINHQADPAILDPDWIEHGNQLLYDPTCAVTYPIPINLNIPLSTALTYSEGRMWGGSSAHNFLIAVRGTPSIYNGRATVSGDSRWTHNNLLPYMKAIETYTPTGTSIDTSQRGTDGPISVTQSSQTPTANNANLLLQAYNTVIGSPFVDDYNLPTSVLAISSNQQFITPPFGGA